MSKSTDLKNTFQDKWWPRSTDYREELDELIAACIDEAIGKLVKDSDSLTITTEFELTKEIIDNFMVAALEGGITYWCYEAVVDFVPEKNGQLQVYEYTSDVIGLGGHIRLKDDEDGEEYVLTPENFKAGFALACKNWNKSPAELSENFDAESADCVIQFAIFDELIYC